MSVLSYVQAREYGGLRKQKSAIQQKQIELLLEQKITENIVNKACSVSGHCRSTFITEFSPDGTKVASTHGDHTVRVTDIATGKCVRTLHGHARTPWCLAYHPSCPNILASGCLAGQVRIWDLYGHGCEVWQTENSTVIAALTFHPVDHVLIIASGNNIYLWDWSKPEPFAKCSTKYEFERIRWVRFDHLGQYLYTGISNNTAAHRAETISVHNRDRNTASNRPSSLVNAYDSIVNTYHEYRQNSILDRGYLSSLSTHMGNPARRQVPTRSYAHHSDLRRMASFSHHLTQQARQELERDLPGAASNTSPLLNSRVDPFLPSVRRDVEDADRVNLLQRVDRLIGATSQSESPARGGNNEFHNSGRWSLDQPPNIQSSAAHRLEQLSRALNAASDIDISATLLSRNSNANDTSSGEQDRTASNQSGPRRQAMDASPCSSYSQTIAKILAQKRRLRGQEDSSKAPQSKRQCPSQDSSTSEAGSSNNRNEANSRPHLLTRFLTRSENSQTSSSQRPTFRNIRERLQTAIPLSSSSSGASSSGRPVRVISATASATPVSISSQTSAAGRMSGMSAPSIRAATFSEIPSVRIVSASDLSTTASTTANTLASRESSASDIPPIRIISACDVSTSASSTVTTVPRVSIVSSLSPAHSASFLRHSYPSSSTVDGNSQRSARHDIETADNNRRRVRQLLRDVMRIESQLQTVASNSGLSRNLLNHCSNASSQTFHSTPNSGIPDDQAIATTPASEQDNLSEVSSFMGPYLRSRGINMDLISQPNNATVPNNLHIPVTSTSSYVTSCHIASTSIPSREQTSSIDAEIGCPGQLSGAYFLPISSDASRASSTLSTMSTSSVERGSQLDVLSQEMPAPYSDTQNVELVMDQNDNYSTTANMNTANPNRNQQAISVQDQDTNNNSIHILTSNRNTYMANSNGINNSSSGSATATSNTESSNYNVSRVPQAPVPDSFTPLRSNFTNLRSCFDHLTTQMEEEMNYLSRRITALQDTFNNHLGVLRREGNGFRLVGDGPLSETDTSLLTSQSSETGTTDNADVADEVTGDDDDANSDTGAIVGVRLRFPGRFQGQAAMNLAGTSSLRTDGQPTTDVSDQDGSSDSYLSQPRTLLETSLRSHVARRGHRLYNLHSLQQSLSASDDEAGGEDGEEEEGMDWRQLQRHTLHPHYSTSILDDAINRPNNAIQSAINRAIAGAFMGSGESAVANNIISQTHRIQFWDFSQYQLPDLTDGSKNLVVSHCKLHNSASCDISQSSDLLATFVPSHNGFPDDNILAVYSLQPRTRGQCLYTKSFGPNAISISISPQGSYVLVGLAAKRLTWVFTTSQLIGQIFKLDKEKAGEKSMKHVKNVMHLCNTEVRSHVSGNSARWLPQSGQGLVYGTNRGDLYICTHGVKKSVEKMNKSEGDSVLPGQGLLSHMPWLSFPQRVSTSTQTTGVRQSASTQTDNHAAT